MIRLENSGRTTRNNQSTKTIVFEEGCHIHTQSLDRSLEGVLTYLASTYMSSDKPLSQKEIKLNQFLYDPCDPITDVWKKLQDHSKAAACQGVPVTYAWKMEQGLVPAETKK